MKESINEVTNQKQVQFTGTLLSISDKSFVNTNGKNYKVVSVEFKDIKGFKQKASGLIYEGNYKNGVTIGEDYLCTASATEKGVIIQMSHLNGSADRPTTEMFGFASAPAKSSVTEVTMN